jgi:hypothetical protein
MECWNDGASLEASFSPLFHYSNIPGSEGEWDSLLLPLQQNRALLKSILDKSGSVFNIKPEKSR